VAGLLAAFFLLAPVVVLPFYEQQGRIRNYQGSLMIVDELVLIADESQTEAELVAAITPHAGVLVHEFPDLEDKLGIYVARFPVDRPEDLEAIRLALERAGVKASMNFLVELFG
jgi:hypothetical protein